MMSSSRRPTSRFHPGMASMYAFTGASPYPLAICGLPPDRSLGEAAFAFGPVFLAADFFVVVVVVFVVFRFAFAMARHVTDAGSRSKAMHAGGPRCQYGRWGSNPQPAA